MISKRKATIGAIILIIITSVSTFAISNIVQVPLREKVLVNKTKYNELQEVYESQSKAVALEKYIDENYIEDIDQKKLEDGQLRGLFEAIGDPYSVYMDKEEFDSFVEHTKGTFGGIGVVVSLGEDNRLTVERTIKGGPSEQIGIKRGDKIVKVNGKEFKAQDYTNPILMREDIIKALKGEAGTKVDVTLLRLDENKKEQMIDKNIKREIIRNETVVSEVLDENIGYMAIESFDEITADDFKKQLEILKKKNIKGLVIDLRFNPGGILDVSTDIADELMGKGTIVYTEDKNKDRKYIKSDKSKLGLPLAIVVNGESASASEILAGAIKDHNRGELIGTTTFGKGVEPDVLVELPEDIEQIGPENIKEDTQLKKAVEVVREKIK